MTSIPIPSPSSSSSSKGNSNTRKRERERCLKMTHMYNHLQATVPGLFPKASREMIVNKTIEYIKELEEKKQKLEELKDSMLQSTTTSTNCSLKLSISTNNVAFFGIQSLHQPGSITLIFKVFFKHQAQILSANVSVNQGILILAITALVQNGTLEIIKREIMSF
ncbi:PREDICTED: uncharacterized protein LOC109353111 [Lupinus angustifolius]|uniref:uncharacterized protein LOC109353111 n=1 Tax=Lupinus angustifolius TaxID=3871 RepID=UPI00092F815B|nr:PREDICTED: uncharacterized protein LOC109353111 [Lupinus angustifolius]